MRNNTTIHQTADASFPTEAVIKSVIFAIVFILLGCYRICRRLLIYSVGLFCRLSLALLVYSLLGMVIVSAILIMLSYYLIALPGNQVRIP